MSSTEEKTESNHSKNRVGRIQVIREPERIRILVDDVRRDILRVLKEGIEEKGKNGALRRRYEMSVPEIARRLGVYAPKLYHHIDKLQEGNFVEVAHEERKKRSRTSYYRRTAPVFISLYSEVEIGEDPSRDMPLAENLLRALDLDPKDEKLERLAYLINERRGLYLKSATAVSETIGPNLLQEGNIAQIIDYLANIKIETHPKYQEIMNEIRDILDSPAMKKELEE